MNPTARSVHVPGVRPPAPAHPISLARRLAPVREWQTWLLLGGCYAGWALVLLGHRQLGALWMPAAAVLVTLHSSLQHELLHGHPTRSRPLNELLGFPALGLFVPYRRFRALHIAHHRDERLTDPYDDPESWYLAPEDWRRRGPLARALLALNATLLGRMLIGPVLAMHGFWRADGRAILGGDREITLAWLIHLVALVPVLSVLAVAGIDWWHYALFVAWPSMSILMVRTFVEHRAHEAVGGRTAVVEAGRLPSLLFLNNNLHAVHHRAPSLPWYELPARWRALRHEVLEENVGYHFPDGYTGVARRWLLRRREPIVHPLVAPRRRR